MIKKPLSLTIAFAFACIGNIHAIGIAIDSSYASSSVWLSETQANSQTTVLPHGTPSYEFGTFASVSDSFSAATWGFSNRENQAIFYGNGSLYNQGEPLSSEILAYAATNVQFTLTESVDYLLTASFIGIPEGNGASARVFGEIYSSEGSTLYHGGSQTTSSGLLSLPAIGEVGSTTGTLTAGTYSFFLRELVYQTNGGTLVGDFALTLSRSHPDHPHVPDAGSTMMMLGFALGSLGFLRHCIRC